MSEQKEIKVGSFTYRVINCIKKEALQSEYLVHDIENRDKKFIVREFNLIKLRLTPQDLISIENHLHLISLFENEHLAKIANFSYDEEFFYIVSENIEGLTLRRVSTMSVNPLTERNILLWFSQVCDLLIYLHGRPSPFFLRNLNKDNIVIAGDTIKILNPGLERLFFPDTREKMFVKEPNILLDDISAMLISVYELIAGMPYSESKGLRFPAYLTISDDLKALLTKNIPKCRSVSSAKQVSENINYILFPERREKGKSEINIPTVKFFEEKKFIYEKIIYPIFSQKLINIVLEIFGIILFFVFIWLIFHPHIFYRKQGYEAYVSIGGKELRTYRVINPRLIDRLNFEEGISGMKEVQIKGRQSLIISLEKSQFLAVIDPEKNIETERIKVLDSPEKIFYDKKNERLFVIHNTNFSICVVSLKTLKSTLIFPTTGQVTTAAYNPENEKFYFVEKGRTFIKVCETSPFTVTDSINLSSPISSIAVSNDGKYLYAACFVINKIFKIDLNTLPVEGELIEIETEKNKITEILSTGTEDIINIKNSHDGKYLYILCRSANRMKVFDINNNKIVSTILLDGTPVDFEILQNPENGIDEIWILEELPNQITIVDGSNFSKKTRLRLPQKPAILTEVE